MTFEQKSMTASEVLEIMAQVVAEFGNSFVYEKVVQGNYPMCFNWHDGCPSCLIGHVMHRWGMPESFLAQFTSSGISTLNYHMAFRHPDVKIDQVAIEAMMEAQSAQDEGVPWGACLAAARQKVAELKASGDR